MKSSRLILPCLTFLLMSLLMTTKALAAPDAALWSMWDDRDASSTRVVSHQLWQQFLETYVSEHDDGINRVNYADASLPAGSTLLDSYISATTAIDPRGLNAREQFAYWVNLYNAVTVQVVLANPDDKSILRMGRGFLPTGPWDEPVVSIAGEEITLNDIEHRILRPIWQDHRIHFAVNCASIGCPNLERIAYRGDNTETLLQVAEKNYLNHRRGAHIAEDGSARLSSIFKWYREDFGESEQDVLRYIARHNPAFTGLDPQRAPRVEYRYDWSLNSLTPR